MKECCFSYFSCTKFESKERKEELMKSKYSLSLKKLVTALFING
ncbi:3-phosphoglycerate dehydrogenase [Enterococcus faecium]|nr:3-phosphoglycerate dehydrogenase [Enterococcus faecium]